MFEPVALKDLIDLGTSALLTFFLWQVWARLNKVTDVLIEDRKQAAAERQVIAQAYGVSPDELQSRAQIIRIAEKHVS